MQKSKTKSKKKWLIPVIILAVVLAVVVVVPRVMLGGRAAEMEEAMTSSVRSATVQTGSISNTVSGTGTLTHAEAEEVTVPDGVEIDTVYVSAGDQVAQGDLLATVDQNSVLTALADVQEQLDELDEELEDKEDDTASSSITTGVSGRVKKIYAQEDDVVSQVMAQQGALLLLSLDGKMAVKLPASDLVGLGDEVTVTLADGETEEGEVAELGSDYLVVTLTDNGPEYGETVTVTAEDGTDLGSGQLYIHSSLAITGYTGTISSVKVEENQKVSSGKTLFKLTDLGHTAEYDALLVQRQELAQTLQTLTALYQDNTLRAPFDGTIQTVEAEGESEADSGSTLGYGGYAMSFATPSGGVTLLSSGTEQETPEQTETPETSEGSDTSEGGESDQQPDTSTEGEGSQEGEEEQTSSATVQLTAQILLEQGDIAAYEGKFTLNLSGEGVTQQVTNDREGKVTFGELTFTRPGSYVYRVYQTVGGESLMEYDTTILTLTVNVTEQEGGLTAAVSMGTDGLVFTNVLGQEQTGDSGLSGSTDVTLPSGSTGGSGFSGSFSGGGSYSGGSGFSVSSGSYSASASAASSDSDSASALADEVTVLTISPNETMTVTVSVDELDILSIQKGQTANVTIDALETTVEGTVTGIDVGGSSSGGVTRYTVEVTIQKTEQMLANMNASVEVQISQAEDVLVIPSAALQQRGTTTYVYTSYDEGSGQLGDEVEVTTGVSDGTTAEILSGLSEGDTVYYNYSDSGDSEEMFSMMGGGFPGGMGNMGGGEMPSGGFGGGMPGGRG